MTLHGKWRVNNIRVLMPGEATFVKLQNEFINKCPPHLPREEAKSDSRPAHKQIRTPSVF